MSDFADKIDVKGVGKGSLGLRVLKPVESETIQSLWIPTEVRCRANLAHIRQSRPDAGLRLQAKTSQIFHVVPSSLGGVPISGDPRYHTVEFESLRVM